MKKTVLLFLTCILTISCKNATLKRENSLTFDTKYEHSLISKGNNFPDFNPYEESIDLFLVSLHKGVSIDNFKDRMNWSEAELNEKIKLLLDKKWIKRRNKLLHPTIFIASHNEGLELFRFSNRVSEEIANSIEQEILQIQSEYLRTDVSKNVSFEEISFLLLSNVLLDSWQIDNVEKQFLKKEHRPLRNGKYYYYSIMENVDPKRDVFGIYGNIMDYNDTLVFNIYGNNQTSVDFSKLDDLIQNCDILINAKDYKMFSEIANQYFPKLLHILENNRTYFHKIYTKMNYDKEITFDEFFIWWYHFIYTKTTNILAERELLTIPIDGNFGYLSLD